MPGRPPPLFFIDYVSVCAAIAASGGEEVKESEWKVKIVAQNFAIDISLLGRR
jgi:hypothetical protein